MHMHKSLFCSDKINLEKQWRSAQGRPLTSFPQGRRKFLAMHMFKSIFMLLLCYMHSCYIPMSMMHIHARCPCMSMIHVHDVCWCFTSMLHVSASCPCSVSGLHIHAALSILLVHSVCPWCMPMSMMHAHVHDASPCPWCKPISMMQAHVHDASPCPWCKPLLHVHAASPCCIFLPNCTERAVNVQYAPIHVQQYTTYVRHVQYSQNQAFVQQVHLFLHLSSSLEF
jgi:hypothetical protein